MLEFESLQWGFLVLVRLTSFMSLAPFFSIKGVPNMARVGFAGLLTMLLLPTLQPIENIPVDLILYAVLIIKEVIIGLILGYISMMIFTAFKMAGELIDIQMGFAMATVFDPQNQSRITLVGQFMFLFQILMFLAVDGHHGLLMAISSSYTLIPVTGAIFKVTFVTAIIQMFIEMFSLAVRIAAPFMIVFLICDLALGIMARTVPQLNIFILSFPLKTSLGLVLLVAVIPALTMVVNNIFSLMQNDLGIIMGLMH